MRLARSCILIGGGVGLLLLLTLWVFQKRKSVSPRVQPTANSSGSEGITIPSLHLYGYSSAGVKAWTLTALSVSVSPDQRLFHSSGIRDGVFLQDSRPVARFAAGSATYDRTTQALDLTSLIRVDGANGVHLRCNSLHYVPVTHRLRALGPITISTPKSSFTAGMLNADLALNELSFESTPAQPVLLTSQVTAF